MQALSFYFMLFLRFIQSFFGKNYIIMAQLTKDIHTDTAFPNVSNSIHASLDCRNLDRQHKSPYDGSTLGQRLGDDIMICPTCGTELRDGVLVCPICGTKQVVPPPPPPKNIQNDPKIFSKTRIISFCIVALFLIIGLWRIFQ